MMRNKKLFSGILVIVILVIAGISLFVLNRPAIVPTPEITLAPTSEITPTSASEVTITTDKTEYKQGETVKMTIRNDSDNDKRILSPLYTVERFDNSSWIEIKRILCPCGAFCRLAAFLILQSRETTEYQWGQKETWCNDSERISKTISKQVPPGRYRVKSEVGDSNGYRAKQTIYSNEFTIREKELSKSECKEALDGTSCTVGLWYDELGRACGGQSCVELGLGKCYKEECIYLEEYENLSKNPQTDCLGSCKCMGKCNESGPAYFIPATEGALECSANSMNKICCCSGI